MLRIISLYKKLNQILANSNKALQSKGLSQVDCLEKVPLELKNLSGINRLPYLFQNNLALEITEDDFGTEVTKIAPHSFANYPHIVSIAIPDRITTWTSYAFAGCSGLKKLKMPVSLRFDPGATFSPEMIKGLNKIEELILTKGNGSAVNYATSTSHERLYSNSANVLKKIIFEEGVVATGAYVAYECVQVKNIILPDSLLTVNSYAFTDCESLTSITIPGSVTTIGESAFFRCYSLAAIYLKPTIPPVLSGTGGIPKDAVIYVPKGCIDIYKSATNWAALSNTIIEHN